MIPYYKAKLKNKDKWVDGFYFAYPETTYCFTEDYEKNPVNINHCICRHVMSDWGLPNHAECYLIDIDTLDQVGWFDQNRKTYGTERWYEEIINR